MRLCDPRSMLSWDKPGRATWLAALLLVGAFSCSGTDLEHRIDTLAEASGPASRGFLGISVIQLSTGKTLYQRNQDRLFLPASNMKLFTTALALQRLGPNFRFTTSLIAEASGDVALIGSGDPSMSGRAFPYDKDAPAGPGLRAIEDLADQVVKNGVLKIAGDIVGDDRLYPWAPYAPSWTQDDTLRDFGAPVSALTINENVITLVIRPGAHAGDRGAGDAGPAARILRDRQSRDDGESAGGTASHTDVAGERLAANRIVGQHPGRSRNGSRSDRDRRSGVVCGVRAVRCAGATRRCDRGTAGGKASRGLRRRRGGERCGGRILHIAAVGSIASGNGQGQPESCSPN